MKNSILLLMLFSFLYGCSSESVPETDSTTSGSDNTIFEPESGLLETGSLTDTGSLTVSPEFSGMSIDQAYIASLKPETESGSVIEPVVAVLPEPQVSPALAEVNNNSPLVVPVETVETEIAEPVEIATAPLVAAEPPVVNTAPVLNGSPAAVISQDELYLFEAAASDAEGDTLTFSIQNKPGWADFDTVSGRLSGIPTVSDVGNFADIVISVTDGHDSTFLSAFSISVEAIAQSTGSVTLSWTAPVVRTDGEALSMSEIAGYVVYFGTDSNSFSNTLEIGDASETTFTLSELPVGEKYFFTVATKDSNGLESDYSGIVSKLIQQSL